MKKPKTRAVSDVLEELTRLFDRHGIVCIGVLMNCRTASSTLQLFWGDTRKRIPRHKAKRELPHIPRWFDQWYRVEKGKHYFYDPQNERYGPFRSKLAAWKACQFMKSDGAMMRMSSKD